MRYGSIDYVLKENRRFNANKKLEFSAFGVRQDLDSSFPSAFPPPKGITAFPDSEEALRQDLFPNVATHERLLSWRPGLTAAAPLTLASGKLFPASVVHNQVRSALHASLEPSTRANYGSAIGVFLKFCFSADLLVQDIFPITQGLLLAFVSSAYGSKSDRTVRNHLSALKAWHEMWALPWTRYGLVDRALQGVAKCAPGKAALRPPIQVVDLSAVQLFLQPSTNPLHAAVWTCSLCAFWAVCRLGELTVPSPLLVNPARHVCRSHVGQSRSVGQDLAALQIDLPWTKTTGTDGMAKIISSRDDELDPLHALQWHLHLNSSTTADLDSTPLFSYKVSAGSGFRLVPLTKGKMLEVFSDALLRARRPTFSGHSFRIGGATHYWHQGATVDQIKLLGGWASDSFRVYLRDPIAGIAPLQQQLGG
ncbi:hypothetical protein A4X03_0g8485 [Tilletia caries]|uniref:Core-binding (CB) domain-containing protein n=1 Tax=Tilletia caries TaxID=13290 RepID=A0A8T8SII7_9BASI|nr:hypothetical protein A4X03_0g8485 [Tilletia caries]